MEYVFQGQGQPDPLRCPHNFASRRERTPLRDHGVLAPSSTTSAKLRALALPEEPEAPAQEAKPAQCEAICAHHRPVRLNCLGQTFNID